MPDDIECDCDCDFQAPQMEAIGCDICKSRGVEKRLRLEQEKRQQQKEPPQDAAEDAEYVEFLNGSRPLVR